MTSTLPVLQASSPGLFAEGVVILLLVTLLLEYEITRFYQPRPKSRNPLWVAILPVLFVFAFIIIFRLVALLH